MLTKHANIVFRNQFVALNTFQVLKIVIWHRFLNAFVLQIHSWGRIDHQPMTFGAFEVLNNFVNLIRFVNPNTVVPP